MSKVVEFFKKKKSAILNLLGSLVLLAIAGSAGVFLALYQTYSPEKYMDDYYECFINDSYAALYKNANVEESDFINSNSFNQMMVNNYAYEESDKYSIGKVAKLGEFAQATVKFTDSETGEVIDWDLRLEKGKEKEYVFFNEWVVNLDNFIIEDVTLTAHKEVEIIIDDKNITVEELKGVVKSTDEATGVVTYTIDRMFKGAHTIMFVGSHTQPENNLVTFDDEHKFYAFRGGDLKAEEQEAISASTKKIVVEMYNSAFTNAGMDTLMTMFNNTDVTTHNVNVAYTNMLAAINKDNGATLTSIDITYYSMKFDTYDYDGNIDIRFYYTASFEAKEPRDIVDGVVIDGVRQSYIGEVDAEATVTFEYIDGGWKAVAIDMPCIDYSEANKIEVEEE